MKLLASAALIAIPQFAHADSNSQCLLYADQQVRTEARLFHRQFVSTSGLLGAGAGVLIAGACGFLAGGVSGVVVNCPDGSPINFVGSLYYQSYWDCRAELADVEVKSFDDPGPPPANFNDPSWKNACAAKYHTFQQSGPHVGKFQGIDLIWHWCQL